VSLEFSAGSLFSDLRQLAEKPLSKGTNVDVCWHACIEFPTDEETHNDDLQAAARSLADSVLALVKAGARDLWGRRTTTSAAWRRNCQHGPTISRMVRA
jgi:hypothetical protein